MVHTFPSMAALYGSPSRLLAAAAALLLAAAQTSRAQSPESLGCGLEAGPERAVAVVIDGETVRLDDGKEVRLIGALAPRARDVGAELGRWPPEEATRRALEGLVRGRTVALAFQGRREDRHGHVLAHLFITDAGQPAWVQGQLVEQGLARAHPQPENDGCMARLLDRERIARGSSLGLWSHAAYQVRPADRPGELARYAETFQIVRGQVQKVAGTQGFVRLDLASAEPERGVRARRRGVVVHVVWRRALRVLPDGLTPDRLEGRNILVRGWIGMRGGAAEIEVLAAGQIEIVGHETVEAGDGATKK